MLATRMTNLLVNLNDRWTDSFNKHQKGMLAIAEGIGKELRDMAENLDAIVDQLAPLLAGERPEKNAALEQIAADLEWLKQDVARLETSHSKLTEQVNAHLLARSASSGRG